jgi:hypothetical protein
MLRDWRSFELAVRPSRYRAGTKGIAVHAQDIAILHVE